LGSGLTVVGVISLVLAEREGSNHLSSERDLPVRDLLVELCDRTCRDLASREPEVFESLFGTCGHLDVGEIGEDNCDPVDTINNGIQETEEIMITYLSAPCKGVLSNAALLIAMMEVGFLKCDFGKMVPSFIPGNLRSPPRP
jgi:hypothetical protein